MPAFDTCHPQVVRALQKDGWQVRDKQRKIRTRLLTVFIDIHASRLTDDQRREVMFVEVKCFSDPDYFPRDLYVALGQYAVYRAVLDENQIMLPLYLAIPQDVYNYFESSIFRALRYYEVNTIVVNVAQEVIVAWNEYTT